MKDISPQRCHWNCELKAFRYWDIEFCLTLCNWPLLLFYVKTEEGF